MRFGVLGPLEVRRDGEALPLGPHRQRSLLALLLMHANQVVSTDRIIDALWGPGVFEDRQRALWVHVSNLRTSLEPQRGKRSEGSVVLTRAPGYLLRADPGEVDALRFEQEVQEGRSLLDTDPAAASTVLASALALWRGRPYEDVAYESFAQAEIARLEQLRLDAVELRVEADLRRGLSGELVGELEGLVKEHPLREHLTAELMVALYRSGRQAEALRAYRRLRARLGEELGVEPSASLRHLEERIVLGDPSLEGPGPATPAPAGLAVRGYELREPIGGGPLGRVYRAYQPAVGREVVVKVIRPEVADDPRFVRRFEADVKQVARLEHPHVVPLYDAWREPAAAYVVMRFLPGGSLAGAVARVPVPAEHAGRLISDIASALAVAHRSGVVHGDIKPSNVLLDADGRGYLTDFGLAGFAPPDPVYAAPERRAGQSATAASDQYSLAAVLAYALTGHPPVDPGRAVAGLAGPVVAVIRTALSTDEQRRYADVRAFAEAARTALGPAAPAVSPAVQNPYKGLRAFDEGDAPDFFGREQVVERLLARLGEPGERGRFVAVVGPSGSGKSSVVRAGLLPALRAGALPGSAEWLIVTTVPGAHPFEELEQALRRVAVEPVRGPAGLVAGSENGLRDAAAALLLDPGDRLLLVVDQLEELFTLAPPDAARAFLGSLARAVDDPQGRIRVVATLRADFYDRPLQHRSFGELLRRGTEVLTPMGPEELERAIDRPAERLGVRFEPGLVAEIVADVADRVGALPLLEYVLTELFEQRRGTSIELSAYRAMGGVSGALARRAEALFQQLDEQARHTARQMFLRLVTLGEGTGDVRRRVLRTELDALGAPALDGVLDTFGRHRMLTFDRDPVTRGPTVELAHEALLGEWSRLRSWVDMAREDLSFERRLAAATEEWQDSGQDPDFLLKGTHLDQMVAWAAATDLAIGPAAHEFLGVSTTRRDQERAAGEEHRRREEAVARTSRRRARVLLAVALATVLVASLAVVAWVQQREADRLAERIAASDQARALAAEASDRADTDPELAMLLALQSLETSKEGGIPALAEAEEALHWAIQGAGLTYPPDAPAEVRTGPNGRTGIYRLPLTDLVAMARGRVDRRLTDDECRAFGIDPCPTEGLASPAVAGDADLPSGPSAPRTPVEASAEQPLAGTTVTIQGVVERAGLEAELAAFTERTGIRTVLEVVGVESLGDAEQADLVVWPQPGMVIQAAKEGRLVDLSDYLDPAEVREAVGDYLVDIVSWGSGFYALPTKLDLKGLVWYPKQAFDQAGYSVPASWTELVALSERIAADGRSPWCLSLGAGSEWLGTDWIENLVLRGAGTDVYDRWVSHDVAFSDAPVRAAFDRFGEIALRDDLLADGRAGTLVKPWWLDGVATTADPPGCWLLLQGDFVQSLLPPGKLIGLDLGVFPLPPIEPGSPAPLTVGGVSLAAAADRPEVRELVRWLLDPSYGEAWSTQELVGFTPANVHFDPAACAGDDAPHPDMAALRVDLCRLAQQAVLAGGLRFDGSDLMPNAVGGYSPAFEPLAFYQGVRDYVAGGPDNLTEVLRAIDAAWPTSP